MSATQHAAWLQHSGWPDHDSRHHRRTCFDAGWESGRADLEVLVRALVEAARQAYDKLVRIDSGGYGEHFDNPLPTALREALFPFRQLLEEAKWQNK